MPFTLREQLCRKKGLKDRGRESTLIAEKATPFDRRQNLLFFKEPDEAGSGRFLCGRKEARDRSSLGVVEQEQPFVCFSRCPCTLFALFSHMVWAARFFVFCLSDSCFPNPSSLRTLLLNCFFSLSSLDISLTLFDSLYASLFGKSPFLSIFPWPPFLPP